MEQCSIGSGSTSTSTNARKPSSTWQRDSGSRIREAGRSPLRALNTGLRSCSRFTASILRPDQSIRYVRCVGTRATNSGVFQRFVGTGIDVTEHEVLTSALRKSEEELRQMLDFAPQLIGVLGPRRERLYANRVALTYYGIGLEEWRQRSFGPEV